MLIRSLIPMDLSLSLRGYPGATIRGGRGKQADNGWGPKRKACGAHDRPSITLKVAYSESDSKLNSDVRFWLNPNEGNAKLCLTLQIHKSRPEICIEKRERQNDRIHRSQVTYITKKGDHSNVTHHPITIPFHSKSSSIASHLVLRRKTLSSHEEISSKLQNPFGIPRAGRSFKKEKSCILYAAPLVISIFKTYRIAPLGFFTFA